MYCVAGQSSEEEMYNNESAGPALEEFLHLLGERVRLKGFSKYRAQLDTKSKNKATVMAKLSTLHTKHKVYIFLTQLLYSDKSKFQVL